MASKKKVSLTVKIDEDLYKKFLAVSAAEGRDENGHILHLIRTNAAYYERIHGKIDISKIKLPDNDSDDQK